MALRSQKINGAEESEDFAEEKLQGTAKIYTSPNHVAVSLAMVPFVLLLFPIPPLFSSESS
ncbi:hypothetical protein LY76DRAFT_593358 [Colletotrichum caudatum]|nr:hypothetical protein LY76DRAFT_593358 [Colletotrichum caudatum]